MWKQSFNGSRNDSAKKLTTSSQMQPKKAVEVY